MRRLRGKVECTSLPAFRPRMRSADFIEPTGARGANRPAEVYRLKDREAVFFARTFRSSEA